VHPRPWVRAIFFVVSLFGALNLALPLVYVPPIVALVLSAWLATVGITPMVCRARGWRWSRGLAATAILGVLVVVIVSLARAWIPPAPLFLAKATLAWNVGSVESLEPPSRIPALELRERGLVAHTAIYAPAGLRQSVEHVWRLEGRIVDVVKLTPVEGGRREGYRTYSRKTGFPERPQGRWTVDVMTGSGQLIGRVRFRVV
jgi:MFS family permease